VCLKNLHIVATLVARNYSLPAVGGNITIQGSNLGLPGALASSESVTIDNSVTCSNPTSTGTSITCTVPAGIGKGFPISLSLCNNVAIAYTPFFSYDGTFSH
jgi:hypothetical protein